MQPLSTETDQQAHYYRSRVSWCAHSPGLFRSEAAPSFAKPITITLSDQEITELGYAIAHKPQSNRIGILFEQFFESYLELNQFSQNFTQSGTNANSLQQRFGSVQARIQINENSSKVTIGEMDFLYKDLLYNHEVHAELAVKYYLGVASEAKNLKQMNQWIGPNKKDRLDLKYQKLFDQQLMLSEKDQSQQTLKELGFDKNKLGQYYFVKGMLFWPLAIMDHNADNRCFLPDTINPECVQGYWLPINQLPELHKAITENCDPQATIDPSDTDTRHCYQTPHLTQKWLVLDRVDWINDLDYYLANDLPTDAHNLVHGAENKRRKYNLQWLRSLTELMQEIAKRFDDIPTPVQIAHFNLAQNSDEKPEITRYFVTPDSWSDTA